MASHGADQDRALEPVLHEPVLLTEIIEWLRPERGGTFVDCTLGLGGHAEAILEASREARVIGIDRDSQALRRATARLARFGDRFQSAHADFRDVAEAVRPSGVSRVDGVLADLGVSSLQLDLAERGFSFTSDAPLDMRMDQGGGQTAADLLGELSEDEIADLIFEYGEERGARKIARAINRERKVEPIASTRRLADIVVRALNIRGRWRIHPATRTFQALRIAVNDELGAVSGFIPEAISMLEQGGRLAIISFHSLEDRIVKHAFRRESGRCACRQGPGVALEAIERRGDGPILCERCGASSRVKVLTPKPVRPNEQERERNPRSRSALLRVCERL